MEIFQTHHTNGAANIELELINPLLIIQIVT